MKEFRIAASGIIIGKDKVLLARYKDQNSKSFLAFNNGILKKPNIFGNVIFYQSPICKLDPNNDFDHFQLFQ